MEENVFMYVVTLCVCLLLQIRHDQLTCVPVEEARRVLQAYCYQAHHLMYCLLITYVLTVCSLFTGLYMACIQTM